MAKRAPKRRSATKATVAKPAAPTLDIGLPADKDAAIEHAMAAQKTEDWEEAAKRWEGVRGQFPDEIAAYENGIHCLGAAGRGPEREALFGVAADRCPEVVAFAAEFAWLAYHRKDWPASIARWKIVLERFPGHRSGNLGAAFTYSAAGMHAEADALLEAAIGQDPENREYANAYARQAQSRGDAALSGSRWAAMRTRFPDAAVAYSMGAIAHFDSGSVSEAVALLRLAADRLPGFETHPEGMIAYLRYAQAPQQWPTVRESDRALAMARLSGLHEIYPDNPDVLLQYAIACRNIASWNDSVEALERGATLYPDRIDIVSELIGVHTLMDNFSKASTIATAAEKRFPGNTTLAEKIAQLRFRQAHLGEGEPNRSSAAGKERMPVDTGSDADILTMFESLGADCVFGYVQRSYGAEPLGLLRWGSIPFAQLLSALKNRFSGVGVADNIDIAASDEVHVTLGAREFTATDRSYGIWSHTFVPVTNGADLDAIRNDVAKRSVFLARELVEELEAGDKIFVYKDAQNTLTDSDRSALMDAIGNYGSGRLLYVGQAAPGEPTGLLRHDPNGLFVAALPSEYMSEHRVREFQPWVDLCRQVLAAVRS